MTAFLSKYYFGFEGLRGNWKRDLAFILDKQSLINLPRVCYRDFLDIVKKENVANFNSIVFDEWLVMNMQINVFIFQIVTKTYSNTDYLTFTLYITTAVIWHC